MPRNFTTLIRNNAKIVYDTDLFRSTNKTVIFLHGFGGDLTAWDKERKALSAARIPSIAIDLRGHGLSSRSEAFNFYDFKNFVDDVVAILKKENIVKPIIVGHCFGGMITILLEHYYPKVSSGIILVDTNYKPPFFAEDFIHFPLADKILSSIAGVAPGEYINAHTDFSKFKSTSDLDPVRLYSDIKHTSLKTYLLILEQFLNYNAEKFLTEIKKPTLIIEGEDDWVFPVHVAIELNTKIPTSKLKVFPNANHIIVLNKPKEISSEIKTFVKMVS